MIGKWKSVISFDESVGVYTISYLCEGGAISCHFDLEEAKNEYIKMMNIGELAMKLIGETGLTHCVRINDNNANRCINCGVKAGSPCGLKCINSTSTG